MPTYQNDSLYRPMPTTIRYNGIAHSTVKLTFKTLKLNKQNCRRGSVIRKIVSFNIVTQASAAQWI